MPYDVKEHDGEKCSESAEGFDVVNTESGDVKAHHEAKPDADRQVRILTPAAGNYNGITLCTLPTGYRPTTGTKFLCAAVTCNFRIYRLDLTVPKSDLTAVTIQ
jgi:hypothetical protein